MEKRAIIFVILSLAILMAFQYFSPAPKKQDAGQDIAPAPVSGPEPLASATRYPEPVAPAATGSEPDNEREDAARQAMAPFEFTQREDTVAPSNIESFIKVETDLFTAVLSSRGGTIKAFSLKKYLDDEGEPLNVLHDRGLYRALSIGSKGDYSISNQNFQVRGTDLNLNGEGSRGTVSFLYKAGDVTVKRTYTFHGGAYGFDLVDRVEGLPSYSITLGPDLGINNRKDRYAHIGPVLVVDAKRKEFKSGKPKEPKTFSGNVKWIAIEDKYFFSALVPSAPMVGADVWSSNDSSSISFTGRTGEQSFYVYVGPKRRYELMAQGNGLEHIVDFGFFSLVAIPIFWLLKNLYSLTGNYGWSIMLLTIIIRVPFIPLVGKGQRSMKKMQMVQPRVTELKAKYKDKPEKLNKEVMALYKKHKVNPIGGCLPLLLQLPVFFALYKVLLAAIELRSAPWILWVVDLSSKDPYYVMPIIMGATMFLQQKMSPAAGDPKQQKIMQLMPIFFTFLFLSFPSGLVLYWMVNNVLSIGQQYFINKSMKPADLEL